MKALRIASWERYEHPDSRKYKGALPWVKSPTTHDGIGLLTLMDHEDGLAHFGAWNFILQLAAKCPVRGVLITDSKRPLLAREISLKTRGAIAVFQVAIERLLEIGWLEWTEVDGGAPVADLPKEPTPEPAEQAEQLPVTPNTDPQAPNSGDLPEVHGCATRGSPEGHPVPTRIELDKIREREDKSPKEARADASPGGDVPRGTIEQSKPGDDPEQRWHYEKREGWVQELQSVGCKIGPKNWMAWQGLVQRLTLSKVKSGALATPADDRWPDRVEVAAKSIPAPRGPSYHEPTLADLAKRSQDNDQRTEVERQRVIDYVLARSPDEIECLLVQLESILGGDTTLRAIRTRKHLTSLGLSFLCKVPELAAVAAGHAPVHAHPLAATHP